MINLRIKNFQSISSAELSFSGFSCIIGKSNVGKSAVRRAIQSVLFNTWNQSYIRTGSNKTEVHIQTDNIDSKMIKSKTDNTFIINGKTFTKIGRNSPEIENISESSNITTQLEPLYMVAYKDVDNTRILNNLFGIDRIESAQKLCLSDLRALKTEKNYLQEQQDTLNKDLTEDNVKLSRMNELDSFYDELSEITEIIRKYTEIKSNSNNIRKKRDRLNNILNKVETVIVLSNFLDSNTQYNNLLKNSKTIKGGIDKIADDLSKLENYIRLLKRKRAINKLLQYNVRVTKYKQKLTRIKTLNNKIDSNLILFKFIINQSMYNNLLKNSKTIKGGIDKIADDLSKLYCPYCKQIFKLKDN